MNIHMLMASELPAVKADLFRALAHPARIRILELLAARERSVLDLQDGLGLGQPVVSQHLAALRARHLVTVRKEGTVARYALRSPLVADLLRVARELLNHRLTEHQTMLRELRREGRRG
jgi:ArsR family transcriptional regulator